MNHKHSTIIAVDKLGSLKVAIGDLNNMSSPVIITGGKPKNNSDEFVFSYMDEAIIEIWDTLTTGQQDAVIKVIQEYRDEIFSLECSIDEETCY